MFIGSNIKKDKMLLISCKFFHLIEIKANPSSTTFHELSKSLIFEGCQMLFSNTFDGI
jgi:hypothetical protein